MGAPRPASMESSGTHVAPMLSALGDPTRRRVFELLIEHGPTTATALAPTLAISRQAVAKHLSLLVDGGLAASERVGRETLYRGVPEQLDELVRWADQARTLWGRRLDRLG